jgi:hypothetical protein
MKIVVGEHNLCDIITLYTVQKGEVDAVTHGSFVSAIEWQQISFLEHCLICISVVSVNI